jgi:sec-independent protein translocase protein TatA
MFNQIGPLEIGIVLVIVLLIFGPKRLPGLGKSLGTGMREFKESITGKDGDDRDDRDEDAPAEPATLAQAPEDAATTTSPAAARDTEPADQRG